MIVFSPMGSGILTGGITRERIAARPADDWRKTDARFTEPLLSQHLARRVRAAGATMLDAPVSGSVPAAQSGTLSIMAGGPEQAFRDAEPLLRRLGSTVTHVGGNGQGLLLKLAINISLAAQMLAFSEGLLLAGRGGIDLKLAAVAVAGSILARAEKLGYGHRDIAGFRQVLAKTAGEPAPEAA